MSSADLVVVQYMEAVKQDEDGERKDYQSEDEDEGDSENDEDEESEEDGEIKDEERDGPAHHAEPPAHPNGPLFESSSVCGMSQPDSHAEPSTSRRARSLQPHSSDEEPVLSPVNRSRPLSRSPPASRHVSPSRSLSPSSLVERTAALSLSRHGRDVKDIAAAEASKHRARQQRKYHSKHGAQKVGGRQKGSKAKQDTRVKPDRGGFWD
jgi:RIO kinase 2